MSEILFASSAHDKYDPSATLPAKSERLLEELNLEPVVKSKLTAVNLSRAIGCPTVPPLFVKILIGRLHGKNPYIQIRRPADYGLRELDYTLCEVR